MKYNIYDLIKEIKNNDTMEKVSIDAFCDYSETKYLSDIITEIADNNVDIYTSDLLEWLKDNYDIVEEANNYFGDTPNDIIKQVQQAQFYQNEQEIYNNIEDMIALYIYNLYKENGIEEISESEYTQLLEIIENCKNEDYLPSYEDIKGAIYED